MQKLFDEVSSLDQRCYDKFGLTEDILMEHAANGISQFIRHTFTRDSSVIIVCGSGNNGADGLVLARLLHKDYEVKIFYAQHPKSPMALTQLNRTKALSIQSVDELHDCDVLVDAVYGTGFRGELTKEIQSILHTMNTLKAYKIACDIPSGISINGECQKNTFIANQTFTMGALKKSMFSDASKDYVGEATVLNLGLARSNYETSSHWNLLDADDLKLPFRNKQNTHKGSFGHLAILSGDKAGASMMSALSALKFGAGLVSMVSENKPFDMPYSLMHSSSLPINTTALALGMGLGTEYDTKKLRALLSNTLPIIADADIFSMPIVVEILQRKNVVLTPHPKEFVSLLELTQLASISTQDLQKNRFTYVELFCKKYPNVTLLLKGANVIVGQDSLYYVNPHGTSALAKGGSGDVLAGLIGSLLAQGYSTLRATIHASLAHTQLAYNYKGADFSLTPSDLIEEIGNL